jgi:hypothetical protein
MLAHETSPVSGASVIGMTYGAHHGPGSMPAGIPIVPTASTREDRLCLKGRLRQQPASDSAEESWSWAMRTKPLNGCLAKVGWPRQEWQGRRTGVTSAMTTSSQ